jgi:MYXO-CTERM domain-containing protein
MSSSLRLLPLVPCAWLAWATPALAHTYYGAVAGDDATGDGSEATPWATIDHAVDVGIPAEGGHTIIVQDGLYAGGNMITRGFPNPVVVRAATPYGATLTNVDGGSEALRVYVDGQANLSFEGFVFTNLHDSYTCPNGRESDYLIHIQDADDLRLHDNVIFGNNAPGTCNEVLKINRSHEGAYPRGIVISNNVFYEVANAGGADLIDAVRPGEIEIVDNIFWGKRDETLSQSFITLKRQAPAPGPGLRFWVHRNVFLEWGGKGDQAFLQFGEDGDAEVMISEALVENNLFIGNSPTNMAAPMQFKGVTDVEVRANTVVGDTPGGAFGFRIGTEGSNPQVTNLLVRNNVFADPTGTMGTRLINSYGDVALDTFVLDNNLYFNAGNPLPTDGGLTPADDASAVVDDPGLPGDQADIVLPRWDADAGAFVSGSATIREEFLRLVESYGALAEPSAAASAADPANMPGDDIRAFARDSEPDLGAYELGAVSGDGDGDPGDGDGDPGDGDGDGDSSGSGSDGDAGGSESETGAGAADGGGEGCSCRGGDSVPGAALLLIVGLLGLRRRGD